MTTCGGSSRCCRMCRCTGRNRLRPTTTVTDSPARLPPFVGRFDQVMRAWEADPPPVLKSGQRRIGKTQVADDGFTIGE